MKKTFISIVISGVLTLTACGKALPDEHKESKLLFADTIINVYETGRIYGKKPVRWIDYDTMESSVLCAMPNCTHTTNQCMGMIVGDCPIVYDGYIYYFKYSHKIVETGRKDVKRELQIKSQLCRMSTGSYEEEVLTTFTDCEPSDYNGWIIYNNKVFFTATDLEPREDEYGAISFSNGGTHFLCSIDLRTKEYKNYGSICDEDKQYEDYYYTNGAKINGMYEGKIYINYAWAKDIDDVDENDFPIFTVLEFEFDPETETLTKSELPEPINDGAMNNGTYIYAENNKIVILRNGKKTVADVDRGRYYATCFNNKLFISNKGVWIDLNDMSEHSMGKYSQTHQVVGYYEGCYIVINHFETIKLTEEELRAL